MGRRKLLAAVTILGAAALVKVCVGQGRTDERYAEAQKDEKFHIEPQKQEQENAKKEPIRPREQENTKKEPTRPQEQDNTKKEPTERQKATQEAAKEEPTEASRKRAEPSGKPSELKITGITEEALCELFETDTETFAKRLRRWADANGCTDVTEVIFSDRVEWNLTEQKYSVGCELVTEKATGITNPDEGNTAVVADYHRREKKLHFHR